MTLGKECDEMNAGLMEVEKFLKDLGLGVVADVAVFDTHRLGFGKFDGQWRLLHMDETSVGLLTQSPREVRIRAVGRLDALLKALHDAVPTEARRVQDATAEIQAFLRRSGR